MIPYLTDVVLQSLEETLDSIALQVTRIGQYHDQTGHSVITNIVPRLSGMG